MRFIAWNMALAAWLLISAFVVGHTEESAALTGLFAVLIGTFALASPGLRGLRFVNALLALVLAWAALLMPELTGLARVNNAVVAALVFALSLVPGRSTDLPEAAADPSPEQRRSIAG
jgi:hypothetical protein